MLHSLPGTLPHFLLEVIAYAVGARLYWRAAATQPLPPQRGDRLALLAGAICGALIGSKLLHVAEHFPALWHGNDMSLWIGGKSLLGGLLGGTLGVELVKHHLGWSRSTGDAWVPALAVGIIIGRIGCQLSGLWDLTYGTPTARPWGWDYGDGVARHPTAAYELASVALLWVAVIHWLPPARGARFAAFMLGYCVIRLALEFVKPPFADEQIATLPVALYGGLTAIQWAAVMGGSYFAFSLSRRLAPAAPVAT
jgi:phosphatidylglycerol---prolipoprotein diacylglyceryl transferase